MRIRISDDPNSNDPADFELEGSIAAVRELVSTLDSVMKHVEMMTEETN